MTTYTVQPRWRWTRPALRALAGVQTLLVFGQALLAGHLLTGNATARSVHEQMGTEVITWVAMVMILLAVVAWRPGRGPAWPIPVTVMVFPAVVFQIATGFEGRLAVHLPLGVVILMANLIVLAALRQRGGRHI